MFIFVQAQYSKICLFFMNKAGSVVTRKVLIFFQYQNQYLVNTKHQAQKHLQFYSYTYGNAIVLLIHAKAIPIGLKLYTSLILCFQ